MKLGEVAEIRGRIGYRGYRTEDLVAKECGALVIGGKHISQNRLDLSDPDYLSWAKFLESPEIAIEEDDIIIAQRGTLGRSALVKYDIGKATINPSVLILRHKLVNARFLHYTLLKDDSISYVMRCASKTSIPMISQKQLGDMPIYQASLEEQEKIASFLSLIDERIEVQNAIIKEREAQKAALLRRLFDRTLHFPEFTDEWKVVKLGEICPSIQSGKDKKEEGEIPLYGAAKQLAYTRSASYSPPLILIGRVGSVGQLQWIDIPCGVSDNALVIQKGEAETVDIRFLFYCLKMAHLEQYAGGSSQKVITASFLKSLPLHLPPLPEQKKIAALLSAIDERIAVEKEYAALLQKQKAYLLRQMFV